MFRASGYPDEWLAAGDDPVRLAELAAARRRFDAHDPPKILRRRWRHCEIPVDGHGLHVLTAKQPGRAPARHRLLLYFHGGGYVFGPTAIEWMTMARLARLVQADLAVWDYPKVPEATADRTLPATHDAWDLLAERYGAANIVVVGLSAGGGLALSLLLHRRGLGLAQPAGAVLCSPWLDLTVGNPRVPAIADRDVVLSVEGLRRDGELYAGSFDLKHPWSRLDSLSFTTSLRSSCSQDQTRSSCRMQRIWPERSARSAGRYGSTSSREGNTPASCCLRRKRRGGRHQIVAFTGRVFGP